MRLSQGLAVGPLVAVALTIAVSGCGGGNASAPETVTVVETQQETVTEPREAMTESAETVPAETEQSGSAMSGSIRVPNVVGKDHQLAQDTMQAEGLYNLSEEDATGQGRLLLWDRNWTVVSQEPPAGTLVSEDHTIILRSKKDDE